MSKLPLKTIPISRLTIGMFITELDISWMDSPFFSNSRLIKAQKEIDQLKKSGAKAVVIDPNKGADLQEPEPSAETPEKPAPKIEQAPTPETETHTPAKPLNAQEKGKQLETEIKRAADIRDKVKKAIATTLDALSAGNAFDKAELTPVIDQTLESLDRHNQALLNLAHISRRTQKMADHAFSTFCIALNLAQIQKIPQDDIESLGIAALVHESGWAHIPIQLMGKRTAYTRAERELIQKHTELAVRALTRCDVSELTQRIVAEHHELCNGKGYPKKLKSDEIHPLSKLFSVVDHYDEIVHQLTDKPGMLPTNALRTLYVEAQKGIYDQGAVAQIISVLGVYPISSAVTLSNGALGIVREVPADKPLLPLVEIHIDDKGKVLDTPTYIDLAEGSEDTLTAITIDSVLDPINTTDPNHKRLLLNA